MADGLTRVTIRVGRRDRRFRRGMSVLTNGRIYRIAWASRLEVGGTQRLTLRRVGRVAAPPE